MAVGVSSAGSAMKVSPDGAGSHREASEASVLITADGRDRDWSNSNSHDCQTAGFDGVAGRQNDLLDNIGIYDVAAKASQVDNQCRSNGCADTQQSDAISDSCWRGVVDAWWFPQCVLLGCQCSFALMHVSAHTALETIPPLAFASLRIVIAIPFLLLSCRIQETEFRLQRGDLPWLAGMAFFGIFVTQTTVFIGNQLAGAAYAAIFTPTVPVFTALIQAMLGKEYLSLPKTIGIALTIFGTLMLLHIESLDFGSAGTLGLLALLVNCMCFSIYLIMMQHRLVKRPYPFSLFAGASCIGGVVIVSIAWRDYTQMDWAAIPASAWGALLWAALGTSFLAHSGIAFAVSRCAAVVPSMYSCIQTVLTAALSALWLGQMLSLRDLAAMTVIIGGVVFVIAAKLREDRLRHASQVEYQKLDLSDAKADVEGGRPRQLTRVPSTWQVCDFDSVGHVLSRNHSRLEFVAAEAAWSHGDAGGGAVKGGRARDEHSF